MKIIIPHSYWESCGFPDANDEFFRRCAFAGIGPAGFSAAASGMSADRQMLIELSDNLGYSDTIDIEITGK